MAVEAGPEAVEFIAEHGGTLYVYADRAGLKHVKTVAPDDLSIRFEQIPTAGFVFLVEEDLVAPETWNVVPRHFPHRHVDVLWDGHPPTRYGSTYVRD